MRLLYKFINIWVGSGGVITSDKIENAVVNFKVEKSWIQDKHIDRSSITLSSLTIQMECPSD